MPRKKTSAPDPSLGSPVDAGRVHDGGAPLPIRPVVLSADPERIAHSLRVLDILERIDQENTARGAAGLESVAAKVPTAERRAS